MATDIKEFFSAFSKDEQYFLNLPIFWAVTINGVTMTSINRVLDDANEQWQATMDPSKYSKRGGILVAHEVNLPEEDSSFAAMECSPNMGGFLPGYGMSARNNFLARTLSVSFIQTEIDIDHNYFRPWMVAIGTHGLIEDGAGLKATMEVQQFSNGGAFIKGFRFKNVFPTRVEGYSLSQDTSEFLIKSVTFGCQNYEQILNSHTSTIERNLNNYRGDIGSPTPEQATNQMMA